MNTTIYLREEDKADSTKGEEKLQVKVRMLFQTLEIKKKKIICNTQLTTHTQPNKYISSGLQRGTSTACQNGFVLEMKNNLKLPQKTKQKRSRVQLKS